MERLPELKRLRAASLPPELYGEISEFFSSVHPDFAMSGKTSLYVLYGYLQKARKKKISAKQVKRAEEMIRALCAAVDARDLQFGKAGRPAEEKKGAFPAARAGHAEVQLTGALREKFARLGIADEGAMRRVLAFIGEEEFSKRQANVVGTLPERAYKVFFSKIPDFLTTPNFYEAVEMFAEKVRIIDQLAETRHGVPHGLDYTKDPNVLLLTFQQLAAVARLDRIIEAIKPQGMPLEEARTHADRFTDPQELKGLLEKIGFLVRPSWDRKSFFCVRTDAKGNIGGIAQIDIRPDLRYSLAMVSIILSQAGVTVEDLRNAGALA